MRKKSYRFWMYFYDLDGKECAVPIDAPCARKAMDKWFSLREQLAIEDWKPTIVYMEIEGYGQVGEVRLDAYPN